MTASCHSIFTDPVFQADLERLGASWVAGRSLGDEGQRLTQVNPADGARHLGLAEAGESGARKAVAGARAAFDGGWGRLPAAERKAFLYRFADQVSINVKRLAALESLEMGRPISEAIGLISRAPDLILEQAAFIDRMQGDLAGADDRRMAVSWRRPRGVVAAITPWNFPTMNALVRLAPALAAGNTVVLKPSEYAPRPAVLLAQLAAEAGIPDGVFNVAVGTGQVTGHALANDLDVDLISFTGSTATGQRIVAASASTGLKPVLLECGGKSPQVLLDDIFEDPGIWNWIFFQGFWNSGQWCVARTRLLVPRARVEAALQGLSAAAAAWRLGDPRDPATRLGPIAAPAQYERVNAYLQIAREEGFLLALDSPRGELDGGGLYVGPHVVVIDDLAARLVQEEVFGPIMTIQPYDDVDDALSKANATPYGLAATVWTNQANLGYRLARHIDAGLIDVMTSSAVVGDPMPGRHYEPFKQSGFGVDGGLAGLLTYTRAQSVTFRY